MYYNQLTANYKGAELCFYFISEVGIETLEGLLTWQSKDYPNRVLIEVKDYAEAKKIVDTPKLLKVYAPY